MFKKADDWWFWSTSARNVDFAVAKCHFEGSELKNIFVLPDKNNKKKH
jgi:hypothetical protein